MNLKDIFFTIHFLAYFQAFLLQNLSAVRMDSLCLGPVEIGSPDQCIDLDMRQVTIRRESSDGEKVFLMDEMTKYVGTRYPHYARESLIFPNTGLQIDPEILQSTEGFP